jgi:hypothetical protein
MPLPKFHTSTSDKLAFVTAEAGFVAALVASVFTIFFSKKPAHLEPSYALQIDESQHH